MRSCSVLPSGAIRDDFLAGIDRVAGELGIPTPLPPVSVIDVAQLFEPDVLVEVEAYAVLD